MAELKPGDKAPDFSLETDEGKQLTLSDLKGRKVILYVYPAAFTPGCSLEAQDFRDGAKFFEQAGYQVIGLSPDTAEKNATFAQKLKLPFKLLSDPDHKVLDAYGAWGEKEAFGRTTVGVIRSTFVIGADGLIELVEYRVRAAGHVERLAQALGVDLEGF
ncbi:MAG: thioredoxin-dependent thiol peroxidase [Bifidobacteriaceae bacterium]|jgi:peroxiredoxin Q/BCP|nr:thioredoxin-dependent thiol peroxidase [Bifidobacteriaceae bacterium]